MNTKWWLIEWDGYPIEFIEARGYIYYWIRIFSRNFAKLKHLSWATDNGALPKNIRYYFKRSDGGFLTILTIRGISLIAYYWPKFPIGFRKPWFSVHRHLFHKDIWINVKNAGVAMETIPYWREFHRECRRTNSTSKDKDVI